MAQAGRSLAELEFERHPVGTFRVARVEAFYDDVVNNRSERRQSRDCVFEFTSDREPAGEAASTPSCAANWNWRRRPQNLQRTMMGMRTQQITAMGAMSELQKTRTILMQADKTIQTQALTQQLDQAMQSLQRGSGDVEKTLMGAIVDIDQGKR